MAISNYSTLQTEIAGWLNRDDLTSVIPTFIQLAEANINRQVRHWKMEARTSGQQSAGDEYMQIPSDWLETIRLHVTDQGTSAITLTSRAAMADIRAKNENTSTVTPYLYCHADSQFELYPTPADTLNVELLYYQKVPALSASNTTNWLLEEAPDVVGQALNVTNLAEQSPKTSAATQYAVHHIHSIEIGMCSADTFVAKKDLHLGFANHGYDLSGRLTDLHRRKYK